jgi:hypothetical protein
MRSLKFGILSRFDGRVTHSQMTVEGGAISAEVESMGTQEGLCFQEHTAACRFTLRHRLDLGV